MMVYRATIQAFLAILVGTLTGWNQAYPHDGPIDFSER
jgi:hypothetical protein